MTTIIIQQRAGGDTVRALQELGGTLEARKDLIREIRTVLSGSVFTSYVVAGIGIATIVLMNVFTPGVMREMTSSLAGPARARRGRDAVGGRLRADPGHDEGGRVTVTPLAAGLLAAVCVTGALLSVPLLLDRGPVDRLAARTGVETTGEPALAAAAADRPARRAASARGWRPASGLSRREAIARRLDLAGPPGGLTVQRFIGTQGRARRCIAGGFFGFLALIGGSWLIAFVAVGHGLVRARHPALARRPPAPGADRARPPGLPRHPRGHRARRARLPLGAAARGGVARRPGGRGDPHRAAADGPRRHAPRRLPRAARAQRLRVAVDVRRRPAAGRGARRAALGGAQRHRARHAPRRPPRTRAAAPRGPPRGSR